MKRLILFLVAGAFIVTAAFSAYGTPKIAKQTGKSCKTDSCHGNTDNGQGGGGPHANGPGGKKRNK